MSKWHVYSFLKSKNGQVSKSFLRKEFPGISEYHLKEGIVEYNMMCKVDDLFQVMSDML